jgi:hypothetical protein
MKAKLCCTLFLLVAIAVGQAQTLGEFKPKDQSYGLNKLKGGKATRIYIAGFDVNFQIYNEKESFKQGGRMLGGAHKGDAQASLSVGIDGLDEKTVQEITDRLYTEYINKLKAKGLTVITPDEAAKTEAYEDYERVTGGTISFAEIPGVMTATPTGYEYFIKGRNKDGKEKKGGFLGNQAMTFPKISKDLGDAIVGNVDITVLFVQDQDAWQGAGAKIKVKTNLRIVSSEGVMTTNDAKIKFKGSNDVTVVASKVEFYHGKMGAGSPTAYVGTLGKPLTIGGVIDSEKLTSFASGGVDWQGTQTLYGKYYNPESRSSDNTKIIPIDVKKYSEGVYAAAKQFLDHHTTEFLNSF